jgi:hypothetical protein
MPGRNRSRGFSLAGGDHAYIYQRPESSATNFSCYGGGQTTSDVIGSGDCAAFQTDSYSYSGGIVNKHATGPFSMWFKDYVADGLRWVPGFGSHLGVSGVPTPFEVATNAAARTNPSRPYVDIPVDVFDVRPGVERIRSDAENIYRRIHHGHASAEKYLQYQFLIGPMVGDMVKLLRGTDQISRRVDEIHRLAGPRGLRRTTDHGVYSTMQPFSYTFQSEGALLGDLVSVNTRVHVTCHTRWRVGSDYFNYLTATPDQIRSIATRAVYGLTMDFSTLWELMPWSWLLDWYGNIGEYLKATRNIIPAVITDICPMYHTLTESTWHGYPDTGGGSLTGGKAVRYTKQRLRSSVNPVAHVNAFDSRQLGILAAIGATRR